MKKVACFLIVLLLLCTAGFLALAFAMGMDYTGDWVLQYVDQGDGILLTEIDGQRVQEMLSFTLQPDNTIVLTSFDEQESGIWQPTGAGIAVIMDESLVPFTYADGQLIGKEDVFTMYFARPENSSVQVGRPSLFNIGKNGAASKVDYTGDWHAVSYTAMGIVSSIDAFFPDGLLLTLAADGTGVVYLTPDYSETLAWSETADGLTLSGSNFLYGPEYDAQTQTLSLHYASDMIQILFEKATAAEPTPEPMVTTALPQTYACAYFTAAFPENWVQYEYNTYNWDTYYSMQYDLNDANGWSVSNVHVEASLEEAANYRNEIDSLLEAAKAAGKDALDELMIGGYTFYGTVTDDYGTYANYLARVPEASMTLRISVYEPDQIADVLPAILQSVQFIFPIPNPPLSDPPLPADGVPYLPVPSAVDVGGFALNAQWLTTQAPVFLKDSYYNSLAVVGDQVYVLAGQMLYPFTRSGSALAPTGDPLQLGDEYQLLSATADGTLYITDGFYNALTYQSGMLNAFSFSNYLTMHPNGQWGLGYWSSYDVLKVTFTADGMATKNWVLTNLSDDDARTGRFSSVSYVTITEDHIFVAGADAKSDNATRIAMYDLDGNELATFGGVDWMDDSTIGSVGGIVQTNNGILVLDSFYSDLKLFQLDGTFIGYTSCDPLLGTQYPWPYALVPSDNGAVLLLSQERTDKSATELLLFEITGF